MPRKSIDTFDLDSFSARFRTESDRACAILGAALLDESLKSLFTRSLRAFRSDLLGPSRPLGSFSARIKLAGALAWIAEDVRFDLDQARDIRNDFAHDFDHELSFTDQSVADRCKTLRVAQVLIEAHETAAEDLNRRVSTEIIRKWASMFESSRQRFEITVEMLAQHLAELPSESSPYAGPNLKEELFTLVSKPRLILRGQTAAPNEQG